MLAAGLFVATLVLVVWQPRGLGVGWSASAGALAALALGVVDPSDVAFVWRVVSDATFTFVALVVISLVLDEAGFFHWAAIHVARLAGGSGPRLFVFIILLGALIAALFANDGAALLLTPIVLAILHKVEMEERAVFAFVVACGFVADTASLPLVISNLVNIVSANFFQIGFARYAAVMIPVDLVSVGATLLVLWLFFRRVVPARYRLDDLPAPGEAIRDGHVFTAAFPVMGLLIAAYLAAAPFHVPFAAVTGAAALVLMAIAGRWFARGEPVVSNAAILRQAPWQIVVFSIGMYLVVLGLAKAGLTDLSDRLLGFLASSGSFAATIGAGFAAALSASVMNNLPATLAGALAIRHGEMSRAMRELMIYANVVGNDLGPKFTPIGSLATLLWLHVLSRKGIAIGWGRTCLIGLAITPPVLLAALTALWLWLPLAPLG